MWVTCVWELEDEIGKIRGIGFEWRAQWINNENPTDSGSWAGPGMRLDPVANEDVVWFA